MRKRSIRILIGLTALLVVQLACATPSFPEIDEPAEITVPLGPQFSTTEHQIAVLESIFSLLPNNYVYSKTDKTNWDALKANYQSEIDKGITTAEFNTLMEQFMGEFPQGDVIYTPREKRIQTDMAANTTRYGAIGAFISFQAVEEPHVVILDVIPGSPAEKAGLKAHDSIYTIDGAPIRMEEGADVVLRIRGEIGTTVSLTVRTPGKNERTIEITRTQMTGTPSLFTEEIPGLDIGYIRFSPAGSNTITDNVVAALNAFSQDGSFKGIILDLRIAGDNANFPLEEMLTLFLNNAEVSIFSLEESRTFNVQGQDVLGSQQIPLVVLVGEHTSGTAEVFAAAIQANDRGIVIGSTTAGNVEALTGFILPNGGQIAIATASFRVQGEENIGVEGLSPKVRVDARWDEIIASEDPVIQQAIQSFEVQE